MPAAVKPNTETIKGKVYWRDAKGGLMPAELVRPQDQAQDCLVREIVAGAGALSAAIADFKARTFDEIDAFGVMLAVKYQARAGGEKGNITLMTYDGQQQVKVQVQDQISFGPELQAAKAIVLECAAGWSEDTPAEMRQLARNAFDGDKEGKVSASKLLALLRIESIDERWLRAMQAIRDSIRVTGSKRYIRIYTRPNAKAAWSPLSLDAASA